MKKLLASAIVLSLIGLSASPALAANKAGDSCKVAGRVVTTSVQKLVCAKVAKNLKWVVLTAPAPTTTTAAPTTTVAATTTTTTVAAATKPVVTLLREKGTSASPSVNYTVSGDKDLDCKTLSTVIGVDFATKYISAIRVFHRATSWPNTKKVALMFDSLSLKRSGSKECSKSKVSVDLLRFSTSIDKWKPVYGRFI